MEVTTWYLHDYDPVTLESTRSYPMTLRDDGSLDITQLPQEVQDDWLSFGLSNGEDVVYPTEGTHFMSVLLSMANEYLRISTQP